ncbi:MAG: mechanosensitive ion channel family protein [Thermodesulfobacteriaceae bacterium]|nr:mechanosensitive ion channel family protein [Thermodesulfobacteriaceae bacterium]
MEILNNYLSFILFLAFSLLMGFALKILLYKSLNKIFLQAQWLKGEIFLKTLGNLPVLWCFLLAFYLGFQFLKISERFLPLTNKILLIIFVISLTWAISKIITVFIDTFLFEKTELTFKVSLINIIVKIFVFILGFIIILNLLNINITPFLTTLGIAGLAVGLALQDTLSNFFAGLYILMTKQIKPGDYIALDSGIEGFVEDITWRNTTIRQISNNIVIVPNSKLSSSIVTNYFLPEKELLIVVQVGVSYNSDLERVEKVTIEVAKEVMREVPGGVPDFEPFIRYHTFGEFSIIFNVILRAQSYPDRLPIIHEFIKRLHQRYKVEGIEIPFPIRTVYLHEKKWS